MFVCDHEKADTLLFLCIDFASNIQNGAQNVMVSTVIHGGFILYVDKAAFTSTDLGGIWEGYTFQIFLIISATSSHTFPFFHSSIEEQKRHLVEHPKLWILPNFQHNI